MLQAIIMATTHEQVRTIARVGPWPGLRAMQDSDSDCLASSEIGRQNI